MIASSMHPTEAGRKDEYILSPQDLCNLRLVDRRMAKKIMHVFGERCFKHRNHMLSEYSLRGLFKLASHPTFSKYVREISLGPERVGARFSDIEPFLFRRNFPMMNQIEPFLFSRNFSTSALVPLELSKQEKVKLARICHDELVFEEVFGVAEFLQYAVRNLPELQKIILRSYPRRSFHRNGRHYHESRYTHPWGLHTLIDQIRAALDDPSVCTLDPTLFITPTDRPLGRPGGISAHWHLVPILEALSGCTEQTNWSLHIDLNSSEECFPVTQLKESYPWSPYAPNPAFWRTCPGRVNQISLFRSVIPDYHPREEVYSCLIELIKGCRKSLESLQCRDTFHWARICTEVRLPHLRRIDVRQSRFPTYQLRTFLRYYRGRLESVSFDTVYLQGRERIRGSGIGPPPSWRRHFDLMLQIPRLQKIELKFLAWDLHIPDNVTRVRGQDWHRTVTAEGDAVKEVLRTAIEYNAMTFDVIGPEQVRQYFYPSQPWVVFEKVKTARPWLEDDEGAGPVEDHP